MSRGVTFLLVASVLIALVLVPATAYPNSFSSDYYRDVDTYDPDDIAEMINRFRNAIWSERMIESRKRALDFGMGRGYTGELHAKHLLGAAAANDAGGPGRKRRDTSRGHL